MADEILPGPGNTGEWGTIGYNIPDFLKDVRDAVNDFAELLVTYLEIANLALEFVKSFIKAFLDPLVALIEALIAAILAIIRDLKQIGIYITGDWALLGWPPEDLKGGYQGYERRMIARLTDRTDPTRPDAPSTLSVFAFFAYLSVDTSDYERLINFIIAIIRMFGLSFFPDTSRLPVPVIQALNYGMYQGANALNFQFGTLLDTLRGNGTPNRCRVTWTAQPASQKNPLNPLPMLGPSGYIVTVSTVPDGLPIKYGRVRANTDMKYANGVPGKLVQPREYGSVLDMDSQPLVLHGGTEMLSIHGSLFEYNKAIDPSTKAPKNGVCQVFGQLSPASNVVVPLEDLGPVTNKLGTPGDGRGSDFFLQRTFLITGDVTMLQWMAGEYNAVLELDDMPHLAHWEAQSNNTYKRVDDGISPTYYVRVWSTGLQVADGLQVPQWDFQEPKAYAATSGQPFVVTLKSGPASLGRPSSPRKMTFVNANTQEYLKALEHALLVLVLTRTDLPYLEEIQDAKGADAIQKYRDGKWTGLGGVAKVRSGLEDARGVLQRLVFDPTVLEQLDIPLSKWRSGLYYAIKSLAMDIYEKASPSPQVEKLVVDATEGLRTLKWSTILGTLGLTAEKQKWEMARILAVDEEPTFYETLNPDNPLSSDLNVGLAPNMYSVGLVPNDADRLFFNPQALLLRDDEFVVFTDYVVAPVFTTATPGETQALLNHSPTGMRRIYEKFIQADGTLNVPDEYRAYLTERASSQRNTSSGDLTPVFLSNRDGLVDMAYPIHQDGVAMADDPASGSLVFTRRMMRNGLPGNAIITQTAMVLRIASGERAPADGEWIAIRFFDIGPELEEFLRALEGWVKSLAEVVKSIADVIIRYIEFLQSMIVELQQLIRRINALIQAFLNFSFALPHFSGLKLLSQGTDGVLSDLISAKNKPQDSPLAYGAGIAILVPFAPSFIFDLIDLATGDQDLNGSTVVNRPPDTIGTEGVARAVGPPPSDEPDVL